MPASDGIPFCGKAPFLPCFFYIFKLHPQKDLRKRKKYDIIVYTDQQLTTFPPNRRAEAGTAAEDAPGILPAGRPADRPTERPNAADAGNEPACKRNGGITA